MFPAISETNGTSGGRKGVRSQRKPMLNLKFRAIDENGSERSIPRSDEERVSDTSNPVTKSKKAKRVKIQVDPKKRSPPAQRGKKARDQMLQITNRPEILKHFNIKREISIFGSFARHTLTEEEYLTPPKMAMVPPAFNAQKPPPGIRLPPTSKTARSHGQAMLGNSSLSPRYNGNPNKEEEDGQDYHISKALVVIFNQQTFERNGELLMSMKRQGALQDGAELKKLFQEMEFTTKLHTDLKADDIAHEIYKVVTSDEDKGDYKGDFDSLICCIGSHGNSTRFLGHDCHPIEIAPMLEALSSDDCIRFADKPKLFFINASKTSFDSLKGPIVTEAKNHYRSLQNIGIDPMEHAWLSFEVKTSLDASVALMVADDVDEPMVEITIGASKNRKWVIRTKNIRKEENNIVIEKQIRNYLNEFEFKPFWISWFDKDIRVGYGTEAGKNLKLILKDYQSYLAPHRIHSIAIASTNKCHWKFHLPEKPEREIMLPSDHFFLSYSPLEGSKKYRTHKTGPTTRNARVGSLYFQTFVDVFRRTHSSVSLDEIIHQMNKEMAHTFVEGQDGIYRKYDKELITENGLGFRNIYFKTKHYLS